MKISLISLFLWLMMYNLNAMQVQLKDFAEVKSDNILLSDIAKAYTYSDTDFGDIDTFVIGTAPTPTKKRVIDAVYISAVLRRITGPFEQIKINPKKVIVHRYGFVLTKTEIKRQFTDFLMRDYNKDTFAIKRIGVISERVLPDSNYQLIFTRQNPIERGAGLNIYSAKILINGRVYRSFTVTCKIARKIKVLYMKKAVKKGELISGSAISTKDIFIENEHLDYLSAGDLPDSVVAARYLPENFILRKDSIAAIPLIRRNDIVKLYVSGRQFEIWTKAIALQDGYKGDKIWVKNSKTNKRLRGTVAAAGVVLLGTFGR